jgi:uncharacterized protein (DUF2236 family)
MPTVPTLSSLAIGDPARALGDGMNVLRRNAALAVADMLTGGEQPRNRSQVTADRLLTPGLFPTDGAVWALHADPCMIAGGLRALMLQTMHPLAMAGVAQHSRFRDDPLGRLASTANYVSTVIFGSEAEATEAIAVVKHVHERVVGTASDGRPYAANDPHLLTWVHHALVDSFLTAYERYGAESLTTELADAYVAEWAVVANAFGAEPAATSRAELRAAFTAIRPELHATGEAHHTIRFLLNPPLPLAARGPYAITAGAAITMLPRWVRHELRLLVLPGTEPLLVRPAATAMIRLLGWVMAAYPFEDADARTA